MTKDELKMLGFEIVAYAGDARSTLLEVLKDARKGEFDGIDEKLAEANENLKLAHQAQMKVLAQEATGEDMDLGFIFIHGQDHLMTTILLKDIIQDLLELYKTKT